MEIYSKHCQSQTGRARELKFWENVRPTLCVMCHVSPVTCHLSPVTFFLFIFFLSLKKIGQRGGASRGRVCYQRGLPRLVYEQVQHKKIGLYCLLFTVYCILSTVCYLLETVKYFMFYVYCLSTVYFIRMISQTLKGDIMTMAFI